jgi:hypothetical protein
LSLKKLAFQVLQRDTARDACGTPARECCPNPLGHLVSALGQPVWTPLGVGRLVDVRDGYAVTVHDGGVRMRWYGSGLVLPMA